MKKIKKLALLLLAMFTVFTFVSCSNDDDDNDADGVSVTLPESVGTNEVSGKTLYCQADNGEYVKLVFSSSTFVQYDKEDGDTDYTKSSEAKYTYNATTKIVSFAPTKVYVDEDEQEIYGTDIITPSNYSSVVDKMLSLYTSYGLTVSGSAKECMVQEYQSYFSSVWQMQVTEETSDGLTAKDYFDGDVTKFFETEKVNGFKYNGHYLEYETQDDVDGIEAFVTWNTSAKTFTAVLWVLSYSSSEISATKYTNVAGTYTATSDTVTLTFTSFPDISSSLQYSISTGTQYALTVDKDTDTYTYTEPE